MGAIKKAVSSIKKTVKNPFRLAGALAAPNSLGIFGRAAGSQVGKKLTPSMPAAPDLSGLGGAQGLQDQLIRNQLQAANEFQRNLPQYIEGEYQSRAQPLERQYASARQNLMGNLSRRGMLSSGQALKQRAELESGRAEDLGGLRAQTIQDALQRAQAYRIDPLRSTANVAEQNQRFSSQLDDIRRQQDAARQAQFSGGMQMIGSGLGQGFANRGQGKSFFG